MLQVSLGRVMQTCGCDTLNEMLEAGMVMLAGGTMNTTFSSETDTKRDGCRRRRRMRRQDDAAHACAARMEE